MKTVLGAVTLINFSSFLAVALVLGSYAEVSVAQTPRGGACADVFRSKADLRKLQSETRDIKSIKDFASSGYDAAFLNRVAVLVAEGKIESQPFLEIMTYGKNFYRHDVMELVAISYLVRKTPDEKNMWAEMKDGYTDSSGNRRRLGDGGFQGLWHAYMYLHRNAGTTWTWPAFYAWRNALMAETSALYDGRRLR